MVLKKEDKQKRFRVNTHIILQLGSKLISSIDIVFYGLIKNAVGRWWINLSFHRTFGAHRGGHSRNGCDDKWIEFKSRLGVVISTTFLVKDKTDADVVLSHSLEAMPMPSNSNLPVDMDGILEMDGIL